MPLVAPNSAKVLLLKYILGQADPENLVLRLYTNDYAPSSATTVNDLTEPNAQGYAPITLVSNTWVIDQEAGVTTASYPEQTFSFWATITVIGYYVTTAQNALLWAEIFSDGPYSLPDGGGEIAVTPKVILS